MSIDFSPIAPSLIAKGKPLPNNVYLANGELLLSKGMIVESEAQAESLLANGFFRKQEVGASLLLSKRMPDKSDAARSAAKQEVEEKSSRDVYVQMHDVRWPVGETVYLSQQGSSARYAAQFIGYLKNKTVTVSMPIVDEQYMFVKDGQSFTVRAFLGKKAYAFNASVIKVVHSPYPYIHLSYPSRLSCTLIRKGARIDVQLIAALAMNGQKATLAGVISDLSLGGASVGLKQIAGKAGDEGRLKFKITTLDETIFLDLPVVLRSAAEPEKDKNGGKPSYQHGFQFTELGSRDKLVLAAFFHQVETEKG